MIVVAFSGGKDSTALALRMAELGERIDALLFTATGNELPELRAHLERVAAMVCAPIVEPKGPSLDSLITEFAALPNWRQRWCTRMIKIEPCIAYLKAHPGSTLCVGLRADEEERQGLYGEHATYRYPLREWGWGVADVLRYCAERGVRVPRRTDCALCYGQRLHEWYELWRDHPSEWAKGVLYEATTGHTFRSAGRDSWPASLVELGNRFASGEVPRGVRAAKSAPMLFGDDDETPEACRVCRF